MTKRVEEQLNQFYYHNENLRFTLGTLVVTILCAFLIVVATFTQFHFIHHSVILNGILNPYDFIMSVTKEFAAVRKYDYIPQIPVIIFIAALLGKRYGLASIIIYIIAGLTFFPVFALGGGITYVAQYNFGYILGYIFAVFIAGQYLSGEFNLKNTAKAVLWGVFLIHAVGLLYFILIVIIRQDPLSYVGELANFHMLSKICYDIFFSFFAVFFARFTKSILWLAMG